MDKDEASNKRKFSWNFQNINNDMIPLFWGLANICGSHRPCYITKSKIIARSAGKCGSSV